MRRFNIVFILLFSLFFWSCKDKTTNQDINSPSNEVNDFEDLTFIDVNGNEVKLNHDRYSFINLWATWCKPCVNEMPSLKSLKDKVGNNMDFYFASYESPQKVKRFSDIIGIDIPFYSYNDNNIPKEMTTQVLPLTIIVKNGKVIYSHSGATQWHTGPVYDSIKSIIN